MPPVTAGRVNVSPVFRGFQQRSITFYQVELTPFRSNSTKPALVLIPAFIIGGSESIPRAADKSEYPAILFFEICKLESVEVKCKTG